jgi:hypothetical protein
MQKVGSGMFGVIAEMTVVKTSERVPVTIHGNLLRKIQALLFYEGKPGRVMTRLMKKSTYGKKISAKR